MSFDVERLYSLLPAVYRIRDADRGEPLKALLAVIADQAVILEEDLAQLSDDQFIETCARWVVPYIGDLIGVRGVQGAAQRGFAPRAEVANTIGYRRRKGTAAMLEQLAHDVTGWPARAVEFFQLLATTQYMNHIRRENLSFVDVRNADRLEWLGTAFEHLPPDADVPHTVDVRRIASGRGRYDIPNVGIFLWRLRAYSLTRSRAVPAASGDQRRFLFHPLGLDFHPLGLDVPLFNRPETEDEVTSLATPLNVPMPISRRTLRLKLDDYYGAAGSLLIARSPSIATEPTAVDVTDIIPCDLSGWIYTPAPGKVAVDPVLGRLAFGDAQTERVFVTFHYGFSANVGGGEYDRVNSIDAALSPVYPVANVYVPAGTPYLTVRDALADLALGSGSGAVEITDSGRYEETGSISIVANGKRIEVRSGDKHRPTVVLSGPIQITGDEDGEVTLNGLLIVGASIQVTGSLGRLRLRHCTLLGRGVPALIVNSGTTAVEIDRCILAGLQADTDCRVSIVDSIVDAGCETGIAYAGATSASPAGGALRIESSTVIGKVHAVALELASNTIFMSPVTTVRRQEGCVRFCYVAPDSLTPRRYRCQPETAADAARVRPLFTSTSYGDPGYAQLSTRVAEEIWRGADDESEMGMFRHLLQPQREAYLRARLADYLRFTLEAGVILAS